MTSLLDYVEEKIRESDNPFQSDYRSEVDTLISLAFPSTQKPRQKNVGIGRIDTDSMSEEEYNRWFQGQGRLAESHPVASVVGPLKGANLLRKLALRKRVNQNPTTAPLAITDQTYEAPLAEPLRLEGPPDLPMLTYDGPYDQAIAEDLDPFIDGGEANPPPMQPLTPEQADAAERHWNAQQDQLRDEYYLGLEAATEDIDPDAAYPAEVNQEYNPDYDGGFPEQGDFDDVADHDYTADELIQLGDDEQVAMHQALNGILGQDNSPPLSDEAFYTKPKGYYSVLDKIIEGDSLTKAEKESAVREMKYRMMSSDNKLFEEIVHDPTRDIYAEMTADEDGNIIDSPIPGINDIEAIKKFKEKRPLEFTVRHSDDTVGGMPGDKATHLYFGGTNLKRQSDEFREHFFTNGRPAQAFITWNERNGSFNMDEIQSEMSGTNPYGNQVLTKLAQQTWLNFKDSGLSTITIPNGESIFDKYYSTVGKGLWGDEKNLLKTKNDEEFYNKAFEFYNQPLIQNEAKKDVHKHLNTYKTLQRLKSELNATLDDDESVEGLSGEDLFEMTQMGHDPELIGRYGDAHDQWNEIGSRYGKAYADSLFYASRPGAIGNPIQASVDELTSIRAKNLKDLRDNYQGKVRHYNKYFKAWQKAGKQHGAELDIKETPEGWDVDLTNPEETFRKVETDGFPMAMLLKKNKKRQVA